MKNLITYLWLLLCLVGCQYDKENLNTTDEQQESDVLLDGRLFDNLDLELELEFQNPPKAKLNIQQYNMVYISNEVVRYIWELVSADDPNIGEDALLFTFQKVGTFLYINYPEEEIKKEKSFPKASPVNSTSYVSPYHLLERDCPPDDIDCKGEKTCRDKDCVSELVRDLLDGGRSHVSIVFTPLRLFGGLVGTKVSWRFLCKDCLDRE